MGELWSAETMLGYTFNNPDLLSVALTHSSWVNEHGGGASHNERLEFLGDAVLELCVSSELFLRFPLAREGVLTRMRSRLVSAQFLAGLARELGLDRSLRLGRGEESQGGRQRDALLSDALEAVLGAVYQDGGHDAARRVVGHIFRRCWPCVAESPSGKDFKTRLQETTQRLHKDRPVYVLIGSSGPEHAKCFNVRLDLPGGPSFTASGPSLKRAEQEAARAALEFCLERERRDAMPKS